MFIFVWNVFDTDHFNVTANILLSVAQTELNLICSSLESFLPLEDLQFLVLGIVLSPSFQLVADHVVRLFAQCYDGSYISPASNIFTRLLKFSSIEIACICLSIMLLIHQPEGELPRFAVLFKSKLNSKCPLCILQNCFLHLNLHSTICQIQNGQLENNEVY